jgi:hypothetical protein
MSRLLIATLSPFAGITVIAALLLAITALIVVIRVVFAPTDAPTRRLARIISAARSVQANPGRSRDKSRR